jgi:hypothetical protein
MASISGDYSTNLVSYWELEETSGTRVDSHGSNDLTDNNTVTSATGIQGTAASFAQANSEWLEITDANQTGLEGTGSFSVAGWGYLASTPALNDQYGFVTKWHNTGAAGGTSDNNYVYKFAYINDGGTVGWQIRYAKNPTFTNLFYNVTHSIETWYHYAFVFDDPNNITRFYINGSQVTTGVVNITPQDGIADFKIGGAEDSEPWEWDGRIDEVGFWNRVLSAGEVSALYNSGDGIPYDAGANNGFALWWA